MTEAAPGRGRTARIFALVGAAHTMSHIYLLALPPMYPLLKAEFDVSYAALGLLVTLLNVATGFTQVPVGFLVDRVGARKVLIAGLTTIALCIGAIGFAASYWMVLPLMVLAGVGNSVFHPAERLIPLHPVTQYEGATQLSVGERVVGRESALCLGLSRVAPLRA